MVLQYHSITILYDVHIHSQLSNTVHAGRKSKADKSRAIVEQLRRHFEQIDTHRTGCISPAELQAALTKSGLLGEEVCACCSRSLSQSLSLSLSLSLSAHCQLTHTHTHTHTHTLPPRLSSSSPSPPPPLSLPSLQFPDLFAALDADSSGAISYSQFLAATLEATEMDQASYEEAFDSLDVDHSGAITVRVYLCIAFFHFIILPLLPIAPPYTSPLLSHTVLYFRPPTVRPRWQISKSG